MYLFIDFLGHMSDIPDEEAMLNIAVVTKHNIAAGVFESMNNVG